MLKKIQAFYEQYDTRIGLGLMAFGFIVDSITLQRIDLRLENLILFGYLMVALLAILVINAYQAGRLQFRFMHAIQTYLPLPMQFAFGGLFSGYVVFYSRSASLIASWPFLIILIGLLVGNEFSKSTYARFTYRLVILYTALFSFAIFYIPVITKRMGAGTFILSGVASLVGIILILLLIRKIARERFDHSLKRISISIASVFVLFNILYFTNIIPPIPLSLKAAGVYHSVQRADSGYNAQAESPPWYRFYDDTNRLVHRSPGEPVYIFTSIFAPTDLKTRIFHEWYVRTDGEWILNDTLSFPIVGGRDGGYRGYSLKRAVIEGRWRVDVVTDRGQLVGRIKFRVEDTATPPMLNSVTL